ncbi:N-acetyltransferase [Uliginosibacterium sp. 31-16]|uniref:GNAT family N-acetyltransferase n=1 Tax=Uliginosibacterium sp. 31-16 TaxID=3068315 RepID=UPI00273E4139|nr:N-acetyltransferase [Uliginosibacterium sp. 31-16]MDP5240975.1 N-acetyltransferase [Uliginosibacterium sp. 31-16]
MLRIRPERAEDVDAIRRIIERAFAGQTHSNQTEHQLVDALRTAGALSASLVAEQAGEIIGHIAFSAVQINGRDCGWFGLAPLAVSPSHQRQGVGKKLIAAGLGQLDTLGAQGCVVLGDPAYYARFGFRPRAGLFLDQVPAEYFMAHTVTDPCPQGSVSFHPAFALCG